MTGWEEIRLLVVCVVGATLCWFLCNAIFSSYFRHKRKLIDELVAEQRKEKMNAQK